jgi:hypothetical protein
VKIFLLEIKKSHPLKFETAFYFVPALIIL